MNTHLELNHDESRLLYAAVMHYLRRLEIDATILTRDVDPRLYQEIEIAKKLHPELLALITSTQPNNHQELESRQ